MTKKHKQKPEENQINKKINLKDNDKIKKEIIDNPKTGWWDE